MDEGWPTEWLRGVLELAVLRALLEGPTYGYALAGRLQEAGLGQVKGGTLYPLLARLEQAGLVRTEWAAGQGGPGRKYFSLTPTGDDHFAAQSQQWGEFMRTAHSFITTQPATTTQPAG